MKQIKRRCERWWESDFRTTYFCGYILVNITHIQQKAMFVKSFQICKMSSAFQFDRRKDVGAGLHKQHHSKGWNTQLMARWGLEYLISIIPLSPCYPRLPSCSTEQVAKIIWSDAMVIVTSNLFPYPTFYSIIINPFTHNVWLFYNIMHERVKQNFTPLS